MNQIRFFRLSENMNTIRFLLLVLLLPSVNVPATIIQTGDVNEINGVKWLDLSVTSGLSLNEVMNSFDGYRVATKEEFSFLFSSFVDPDDQFFVDISSESQSVDSKGNIYHENVSGNTYVNSFYDTFGLTNALRIASWKTNYLSLGMYTDNDLLYIGGVTRIIDLNHPDSANEVYNYIGGFSDFLDNPDDSLSGIGWYMVEESFSQTVPAPATVWLISLGLGLIGLARRNAHV